MVCKRFCSSSFWSCLRLPSSSYGFIVRLSSDLYRKSSKMFVGVYFLQDRSDLGALFSTNMVTVLDVCWKVNLKTCAKSFLVNTWSTLIVMRSETPVFGLQKSQMLTQRNGRLQRLEMIWCLMRNCWNIFDNIPSSIYCKVTFLTEKYYKLKGYHAVFLS